jgi:hypothetical protein
MGTLSILFPCYEIHVHNHTKHHRCSAVVSCTPRDVLCNCVDYCFMQLNNIDDVVIWKKYLLWQILSSWKLHHTHDMTHLFIFPCDLISKTLHNISINTFLSILHFVINLMIQFLPSRLFLFVHLFVCLLSLTSFEVIQVLNWKGVDKQANITSNIISTNTTFIS